MSAPNLIAVTSIVCKTAVQSVGTSATAIVSNAAASGKVIKIDALSVANIHASTAARITVDLYRASTATRLASEINVPINTTLLAIEKGSAVYLEEGDSLRLTASAASSLEAVCSYEEIA